MGSGEASPEKAGVGGSTPSLATIIPNDLAGLLEKLLGPLSVRYFSGRSGSVLGHDDAEELKQDLFVA